MRGLTNKQTKSSQSFTFQKIRQRIYIYMAVSICIHQQVCSSLGYHGFLFRAHVFCCFLYVGDVHSHFYRGGREVADPAFSLPSCWPRSGRSRIHFIVVAAEWPIPHFHFCRAGREVTQPPYFSTYFPPHSRENANGVGGTALSSSLPRLSTKTGGDHKYYSKKKKAANNFGKYRHMQIRIMLINSCF